MKKHFYLSLHVAACPAFFIFLLFPLSSAVAGTDNGCKSLMENTCLECHFETRICQKIQKNKGKRSWKRTIKSMVRHGAELNAGEQSTLVKCFVDRDPEILSFCGIK